MKSLLLPVFYGLIFGFGLALSGMNQPSKVIGFLDITGHWDPSLAFVMGGAIAVYLPVYLWTRHKLSQSILGSSFSLLPAQSIDAKLVLGALCFGAGWGLSGYCPGPALSSVGAFSANAAWFSIFMVLGIMLTPKRFIA
ncbi:MAG: YeeE/YedE family protein [Myxococcales bacterium]|nr:MAG: YeeE/YedE family protein [Myxococcales bacterium]